MLRDLHVTTLSLALFPSTLAVVTELLIFHFFPEADKDKDGVVNGNEAIDFFSRSRLPRPTLAK